MDLEQLLTVLAPLLPATEQLITALAGARNSNVPEVVRLAASIAPIATELVSRIQTIRTQTQDQHEEVWAAVSGNWNSAVAGAKTDGII